MPGIEPFLAEVRELVARECVEHLPLLETFANEARFARAWLAPSLDALAPDSEILEVGAGLMLLSAQLAIEGFHVTAVEPIGEGFNEFRAIQSLVLQVAARAGGRLTVYPTPIESLSLRGSFAFAFSVNVMEHVPDVPAALASIFSVLGAGASYRFTCPNYLFPYEPHFNMPTLFSKALTARVFRRRIAVHRASADPEGLWRSLNWITVPAIRRACRNLEGARVSFDTGMTAATLERVLTDPRFSARRPRWMKGLARLLVATRLARLLARLPASVQPLIDCQVAQVRQAGQPPAGMV